MGVGFNVDYSAFLSKSQVEPNCQAKLRQIAKRIRAELLKTILFTTFAVQDEYGKMADYKNRIVDSLLRKKLQSKGAVVIDGLKWCGKTTTAARAAATQILLAKIDVQRDFRRLLEIDYEAALAGEAPLLIDEWQTAPKVWDAVRYAVDMRQQMGQFILTGSAVPNREAFRLIEHSGAGRFSWITMRTMSLVESGESTGEVKLRDLFETPEKILARSRHTLKDLAFMICRGGWPMALDLDEGAALEQAYDYYGAVTQEDISRVDGVKRSSARVQRLMRSYARHQGTQASVATLRVDIESNEADTLSDTTIGSYLEAMRNIFLIEEMPAWNPNLRSKTAIRTTDTRYFSDPSIAVAALGLGPADLIGDLRTLGLLFETLCVRDLRVYAQALGGQVYHYRDKSGLECDAVIHLRTGHYGLVEIKLGGETLIESGVQTLNALADRVDTSKMRAPAFKMVLIAVGDYAYRRSEDGVYVVPIGCFGV